MSTDDEIKMQNEEQQRQQERHQAMIDGDQDQADGVPPQRPQRRRATSPRSASWCSAIRWPIGSPMASNGRSRNRPRWA